MASSSFAVPLQPPLQYGYPGSVAYRSTTAGYVPAQPSLYYHYHQQQPAHALAGYVPADYGVRTSSEHFPSWPVAPMAPVGSINAVYAQPAVMVGEMHAAPAASSENKQRCTKCAAYFTLEENVEGACRYHSGKYRTPESAGPIMMPSSTLRRWSCCKALDKDTPGCRTQKHTIDATTAAILRQFAPSSVVREGLTSPCAKPDPQVDEDVDQEDNLNNKLSEEEEHIRQGLKRMQLLTSQNHSSSSGTADRMTMVRHLVAKTDTIVGISLRYGVSVDDIKRANNLTSQSIFAHKYLLVPNPARMPAPEELSRELPKDGKKSIALERFRTLTKCNKEEAQYYLEENDFDLKKAIEAFNADIEWEKKTPPKKITSVVKY